MASFQERITIFIETKVDNAKSQLGSLKQSVQDAEGATGKLKAAAGGLGGVVNSAASALPVVPAIGRRYTAPGSTVGTACCIKASSRASRSLGLTIGKVSAATGLLQPRRRRAGSRC